MRTRTVLPSVMRGFLGRYTSRNTEHDGYWLLGFLVNGPELRIDLIGETIRRGDDLAEEARLLAIEGFGAQVAKAKIPRAHIARAALTIRTLPEGLWLRPGEGWVRRCKRMQFEVIVRTDLGNTHAITSSALVAPHDPALEWRSGRETEEYDPRYEAAIRDRDREET